MLHFWLVDPRYYARPYPSSIQFQAYFPKEKFSIVYLPDITDVRHWAMSMRCESCKVLSIFGVRTLTNLLLGG